MKPASTRKSVTFFVQPAVDKAGFQSLGGDRPLSIAADKFQEIGATLAKAGEALFDRLNSSSARPKEVELELSVGFEAEGNWFIAKGKANANATVKLVWK